MNQAHDCTAININDFTSNTDIKKSKGKHNNVLFRIINDVLSGIGGLLKKIMKLVRTTTVNLNKIHERYFSLRKTY
jgi:hypothetical protein